MAFVQTSSIIGATATLSATATAGNLLIASCRSSGGSALPALPGGWTNLATITINPGSTRVCYKIADGSETDVTFSGASSPITNILEYSGVTIAANSSIIVNNTDPAQTNNASPSAGLNGLALGIFNTDGGGGTITFTGSNLGSQASRGSDGFVRIADREISSTSGDYSATLSRGSNIDASRIIIILENAPTVEARVAWLEIELPEAADTEQSSDTRDLRITGRDTSEASRNLRVTGAATSSDSRQLRVTGQDSASQTRSMRIIGKAADSATRALRITGRNSSFDSRNIRITGTTTDSATRSIRIVGAESSSATRDLRIFGAPEQNAATRDLRIVGTATESSQVSIRIFGRSSGDDPANEIELDRTINYADVEVIPSPVIEQTVNRANADDGRNSIEVLPENG